MKSLSNNESWESTFPKEVEFAIVPKQLFGRCSVNAICVYAALAMYRNYGTNICWPSHRRLAENVGLSISTIKRAIKELCDLGVIEKGIKRYEHGGIQSCIYRLCTPWVTSEPSPSCGSEHTGQSTGKPSVSSIVNHKREETNKKNFNDTFSNFEEILQAVCEATRTDRTTISSAQKKSIEKLVIGFMAKNPTAKEILSRATAMKSSWSKGKVTPRSLINNWDYFGEDDNTRKPEYGINPSRSPWEINNDGEAVLYKEEV